MNLFVTSDLPPFIFSLSILSFPVKKSSEFQGLKKTEKSSSLEFCSFSCKTIHQQLAFQPFSLSPFKGQLFYNESVQDTHTDTHTHAHKCWEEIPTWKVYSMGILGKK